MTIVEFKYKINEIIKTESKRKYRQRLENNLLGKSRENKA